MESTTTTRPRSKSTFSFRSDKSKPKIDLTETAADKNKSRFSKKSKVDPTRALNEPQPLFQAQEASTLPALRATEFRDMYGNTIVDPDKTNPTRHRLERPLDTIRAFEAAVDNSYKRRSQAVRAESADAVPYSHHSRRPSAFSNDIPHHVPKYSPASVIGSRAQSMVGRSNYEGSVYGRYSPRRSMAYNRSNSSPLYSSRRGIDHQIYNPHAYHESHDTLNTAAESSGSQSEPWGYSTDPSSENSSIDRLHAAKHMDTGDAYSGGNNRASGHFGRGSPMRSPIQEEYWHEGRFQGQDAYEQQHMQQQTPMRYAADPVRPQYQQPAPVPAPAPQPRKVIQLGGTPAAARGQENYSAPSATQVRKAMTKGGASDKDDKKGGWLKRRFSKN